MFTEIINYAHNIDFTKLHVEFIKIDTFVSFLIEYFLFLASGTFNLYYLVSPISLYVLKCYEYGILTFPPSNGVVRMCRYLGIKTGE